MSNSANCKRALERAKCREALSKHIYKRLSMNILPSEVRLQPLPRDGYSWRYEDAKHHLFAKSLSELSTNTYIQLQKALERGEIWAVEADQESTFIFRGDILQVEKLKQDLRLSQIRQADLEKHNSELQKALQSQQKKIKHFQDYLACNKKGLKNTIRTIKYLSMAFEDDEKK